MHPIASFVLGIVVGAMCVLTIVSACCCRDCVHDHCEPASCCPPEIVKRIEALEVKVFRGGAVEEEAK